MSNPIDQEKVERTMQEKSRKPIILQIFEAHQEALRKARKSVVLHIMVGDNDEAFAYDPDGKGFQLTASVDRSHDDDPTGLMEAFNGMLSNMGIETHVVNVSLDDLDYDWTWENALTAAIAKFHASKLELTDSLSSESSKSSDLSM